MKSMIIAAILLAGVLFGGAAYTKKLTVVSIELMKINKEIQLELEAENYENAKDKIGEMSEYLTENEPVLSAMGNHEEIDKMQMNIAELYRYSNGEMQVDALSKSEVLDFLYLHLPKNYRLKLENIF